MIRRQTLRIFSGGIALCIGMVSSFAVADRGHDDRHYSHGDHWHGDIRYFHVHDYPRWREGRWYHGRHGGAWGWWWIAADSWYLYPAPIYPYPDPYEPPVVVQPQSAPPANLPAPPQNWYYCRSTRAYYPYVSTCPEGWQAVPAQPADAPAP